MSINSLSNFINSASDDKFTIEINRDEKLNRLSAAIETPTIPKYKPPEIPHTIKYRLLRRQDEYILQKSKIHDGNLIWIDTPTIIEDVKNEMA